MADGAEISFEISPVMFFKGRVGRKSLSVKAGPVELGSAQVTMLEKSEAPSARA